jgi:hypothetical protein
MQMLNFPRLNYGLATRTSHSAKNHRKHGTLAVDLFFQFDIIALTLDFIAASQAFAM